jgi:tetraprenyl-beta-curcumene synthase
LLTLPDNHLIQFSFFDGPGIRHNSLVLKKFVFNQCFGELKSSVKRIFREEKLITKYVTKIFPMVSRELKRWAGIAKKIPHQTLREQALASIAHKRFHAQGGSIYALFPKVDPVNAVKFIVAFQTISDYLDNLCDRAGVFDESAFRQLHLSMLDAVEPEQDFHDYYRFYPCRDDHDYLLQLVRECRTQVSRLPSYPLVLPYIKKYVLLYSDLQTYKHLTPSQRDLRLTSWAHQHLEPYSELFPWEFSAATGSTLGIFVLAAAATDPLLKPEAVKRIDAAYFPWIAGLHILLDYYIDCEEDQRMGDLNFVSYYQDIRKTEERLGLFVAKALDSCSSLPYPRFHRTVVCGILAMYLSDPKALLITKKLTSERLIKKGGPRAILYHQWCRLLRKVKVI